MEKIVSLLSVLFLSASFGQNIMVNQVGYLPEQTKIVYFTQPADSFFVIEKDNNKIVFSGKPELHISNDPATGMTIYTGDFSFLTNVGTYQIKTSNQDTSFSFLISPAVFNTVYDKSMKGFYFQRCGTALLTDNAGVYARPACHLNDGVFHSTTGKTGSANEVGGWHDAGDYGKYVVNAGITVGTLLMAYEQFPDNFKSDNLNIPESGNTVPDILDEVRYELNWLLKIQDTSDGGVYFKVTPQNFEGFIMPNTDNSIRYIYQKSSTATGDFAAMMAMAARIYLPFDSTFAKYCLAAAEKAWQYLESNPSIVPPGGFHNPTGTNTGEYGDGNDSDERLWAAVELYNSTGESSYQNYFLSNYQSVGLIYYAMSWGSVGDLAQLEYLLSKQSSANSAAKVNIKNSLLNYCSQLYNTAKTDGFNVTLKTSDYYWGSNSVPLNNAILLIIGYQLTGNKNFYNTALEQLNYILGTNANNICYITGVGEKSPKHIHHRPSASDGIIDPVPGLMAGGPNKNINQDPVLQSHFTTSTPPALCYIDDQGSYASNEICINWNAPLVFVAGYFSNLNNLDNIKNESGFVPNGIDLQQNFPNPFNSSTVINITAKTFEDMTLEIYDITGKEILKKNFNNSPAGKISFVWNGKNDKGELLSSGIYFYRITGSGLMPVKKMIMLK